MSVTPVEPNPRLDELISFTEACGLTGKSYWTLKRAANAGKLEVVRLPTGDHALMRASVETYAQLGRGRKS